MIACLHKFVRHHAVEDHLRLGWMMTAALCGTHHGNYSMHMVWLCQCKVAETQQPKQWDHLVKHPSVSEAVGSKSSMR